MEHILNKIKLVIGAKVRSFKQKNGSHEWAIYEFVVDQNEKLCSWNFRDSTFILDFARKVGF